MKKIIFALGVVLLIAGCASHRNSKTSDVLDGIFDIRLGMSIEEMKAVVDTSQLIESYAITDFDKIELLKNRRKFFTLQKYTPHRNYETSLYLDFFNDKLYEISIGKNKEGIERLLTQKYGKPKIKNKDKVISTEYKPYAERTGEWDYIKSREWKLETTKRWKTNDKNIECKYYYHSEDHPIPSLDIVNLEVQKYINTEFEKYEKTQNEKLKKEAEKLDKSEQELIDAF